MADLRIVDAPLLSTVKGTEKIPTGGEGNFSVSVNQVADFAKLKWLLATEDYVDNAVVNVQDDLNQHKNNSSNPHGVTKVQVGLGNVDNTADLDKPVSNATQSAIITANSGKADKSYVDYQDKLKADKITTYTKTEVDSEFISIYKNGATLPYDAAIEYAEGAVVVKDGELQKKQGASWVSAVNKGYNLDYFVPGKSYPLHAEIMLTNGDIVKSTVANNAKNPNVDMTGWINPDLKQRIINELAEKKFYSVLEEGASLTATAEDNYAAIQRTIAKAQAGSGVVWFPKLHSRFQDGVVPDGFKFNQQIVFPPKLSVVMETPLIWTGGNNTIPLVYGEAMPINKSRFSEYIQVDAWLYNENAADWGNPNNIGVWIHPHQFCTINLKVVQGFELGVVLNGDKQGFVYNNIYVNELRGNRIGMKWLASNNGWVNENTFYKGRISSATAPAGKGAMNRYGLVTDSDNFPIENNYWLTPCFELGYDADTPEAVPISLNRSSGNSFVNIRAERHKEWIARITGVSDSNSITTDYGRNSASVPMSALNKDWKVLDDQSTHKNNHCIPTGCERLFYKPFSTVRVDNFKSKFYGLDAGYGAIQGLAVASSSPAYPSILTYEKSGYADTVDADGGLKFGSASVRRAIRIKTNGARNIVIKQSGSFASIALRSFDASKNLLYSTTTQYVKELGVNGSGGAASASFGGCYVPNPPLHGVTIVNVLSGVEFLDIIIGGATTSVIYSVEISTPDFAQLQQIPFFANKEHNVKPTVIANVETGTVVYNSAYAGTGVYAWLFAGGAWRDLT
ncbi:MAG: hypothetical protein RSF87_12315 [Cellulosilyticaceae bacterium]